MKPPRKSISMAALCGALVSATALSFSLILRE
jgi:hypothetical protein